MLRCKYLCDRADDMAACHQAVAREHQYDCKGRVLPGPFREVEEDEDLSIEQDDRKKAS
jgi:hypothetical protein